MFILVSLAVSSGESSSGRRPKFIFIFLADGAGLTHLETARMYNRSLHGEGFQIVDKIFQEGTLGLITTHSDDSLTTDSAAAATAMANGCKAKNTVVGICADGRRTLSVMEVAKKTGLKLGLITNSTIYDASPAAFASHVPSRNLSVQIIDAYLRLEPDLLMGGGREQLLRPSQGGGSGKDSEDFVTLFKNRGYAYLSGRQDLDGVKGPRVLGLFSPREMSFELDRERGGEPSLTDMTRVALEFLQRDDQGFVLFVENENVDSAAHLSDVASVIHELRELDRAVGLAHEFYLRHSRETLILVISDHETGGLNLTAGVRGEGRGRAGRVMPSKESLRRIGAIKISIRRALEILGKNPKAEDVEKLMADHFPGFSLSPRLKEMLIANEIPGPTFYADWRAALLGAMVAQNTQAYWIGRGHTNQPVFVGALGAGAERFRGYQDNTDFAKHLFDILEKKEKP